MDCTSSIKISRLTDTGIKRDRNEDYVGSDMSIGVAILADGVGGGNAGELASEIAVISTIKNMKKSLMGNNNWGNFNVKRNQYEECLALNDSLFIANSEVYSLSKTKDEYEGMSSTVVGCVFVDNKAIISYVGDSRAYLFRNNSIKLLTRDHSWINEQIDSGFLTEEMAKQSKNKNLITRAIGTEPNVAIDTVIIDVSANDIILLCSDGLSDLVTENQMVALLKNNTDLEQCSASLIQEANNLGGKDNISVILAKVVGNFNAPSPFNKLMRILTSPRKFGF